MEKTLDFYEKKRDRLIKKYEKLEDKITKWGTELYETGESLEKVQEKILLLKNKKFSDR